MEIVTMAKHTAAPKHGTNRPRTRHADTGKAKHEQPQQAKHPAKAHKVEQPGGAAEPQQPEARGRVADPPTVKVFTLHPPDLAADASDIKVKIDTARVSVPKPVNDSQKRIKLDKLERHPAQPRRVNGSEKPDTKLILGYLGRHGPVEEGDYPPIGQDIRWGLPKVAHHKGRYTILQGHRRIGTPGWFKVNAPDLFTLMFPDDSILCDVLEIDPNSPDALALLNDHALKDERRDMLIIEYYDLAESVRKANADLGERFIRELLHRMLGKQRTDQLERLKYLPPKVIDRMRKVADNFGKDAYSQSQLNDLYTAAQAAAKEQKEQQERERLAARLKGEGKTEKEIRAEVAGFKLAAQQIPRPDPKNPGEDFEKANAAIIDGKTPDVPRAMNRNAITALAATLAGSDGVTKESFATMGRFLTAIADGKQDDALKHGRAILATLGK
jgi:hypothetical protein